MSDGKQMDCYYASGITPTEAARQAQTESSLAATAGSAATWINHQSELLICVRTMLVGPAVVIREGHHIIGTGETLEEAVNAAIKKQQNVAEDYQGPPGRKPPVRVQPVVSPLPCPFCGSTRITVEWEPCEPLDKTDTNRRWFAECTQCSCQGPFCQKEPQVIPAWNKRANAPGERLPGQPKT